MDPNRPDIAIQAATRPLNSASQSETSNSDMEVDPSEEPPAVDDKATGAQDLVSTAQAANDQLRLVAGEELPGNTYTTNLSPNGDANGSAKNSPNSMQPDTNLITPSNDGTSPRLSTSATSVGRRVSNDAVDGLMRLKEPSPKRHRTNGNFHSSSPTSTLRGSLATSPTTRNNALPASQGSPQQKLPAMQAHSPSKSHTSPSPRGEHNLPPLDSYLTQLAEAAAAEKEANAPNYDPRSNGIVGRTRQSFSAISGGARRSPPTTLTVPAAQDRRIPGPFGNGKPQATQQTSQYQPPHPHPQNSPGSTYRENSPQETFRQSRELPEISPQLPHSQQGARSYYYNRRASQAMDNGPPYTAAPSSEDQHSQILSSRSQPSSESFSPSTNPTPADHRVSIDSNQPSNGHAPPQSVGPLATSGFKCDFEGCPAPPFQTQYLLNSHANVHSQIRSHYCPMKGCPRAEGGKGFKRKNEMIRHGLVHDSPGYVCPFCPDREHKYPRPDNLQRHVRVHHVDKDKDDIQLREVLAQRPEGGNRGRRRRLGG